jgi:hypothetical protein
MTRKTSLAAELKNKRAALLFARRTLERLQEKESTPAYKIDQQWKYIRELQTCIRELEEELVAAGVFARGHALVIGAGEDLQTSLRDAAALAAFLKLPGRCAYLEGQVYLLAGPKATRTHVLSALDDLAQSAGAESTVVVYFSGHGCRVEPAGQPAAFYLMPYGYDADNLASTCISGEAFADKLAAIRSRRLVVLLDCCHAGAAPRPGDPDVKLSKASVPLKRLSRECVLLASSRADEESYAGRSHSEFTIALLEALAGVGATEEDGTVRVMDVALYVSCVVPGRTEGKQHPVLKFRDLKDDFPLAYYAAGDEGLPPLPQVDESQVLPATVQVERAQRERQALVDGWRRLLEIELQMAAYAAPEAAPPELLHTREEAIREIERLERNSSSLRSM